MDLVISAELKSYILSKQMWAPPEDYYYQRVKRLVDDILFKYGLQTDPGRCLLFIFQNATTPCYPMVTLSAAPIECEWELLSTVCDSFCYLRYIFHSVVSVTSQSSDRMLGAPVVQCSL